jgi:hypothetical protein
MTESVIIGSFLSTHHVIGEVQIKKPSFRRLPEDSVFIDRIVRHRK